MFILIAILIGILIGLIRGGSLKTLFTEKLVLWPLGLIGVIVQIGLHVCYAFDFTAEYLYIVNYVSYALILVTLVFNIGKCFWSVFVSFGTVANAVVCFLNGGRIPVSESVLAKASDALVDTITSGSNAVYQMMDKGSDPLWFLGHCVGFPFIGKFSGLYGAVPGFTIGGVLVFIGLVGWVQSRMVASKKKKKVVDVFADDEDDENYDGDDYLPGQDPLVVDDLNDDIFYENFDIDPLRNSEDVSTEKNDFSSQQNEYVDDDATMEMIPRLTPELAQSMEQPIFEDVEPDEEDEPRVYTAIRDLNHFDAEPLEGQMDGLASDATEDDIPVDQSRWGAWEPRKEVENPSAWNDNSAPIPVQEESGSAAKTEEKANSKSEWNPKEVDSNTYASSQSKSKAKSTNPYSTFFGKEASEVKGHSTDEMRDIWHRISVGDQAKYKRSGLEQSVAEPVGDAAVPESAVKEEASLRPEVAVAAINAESQAFEKAREAMAKKWDANAANKRLSENLSFSKDSVGDSKDSIVSLGSIKTASTPNVATELNSTKRVDSKEVLRRSLDEKKEEEKAAIAADAVADAERERAGYEKVEATINGQVISFWRKKKES